MARKTKSGLFIVSIAGLCLTPTLEAQKSFTFLQGGFTQELFGNAAAAGLFGGSALAPNGDIWVDFCAYHSSPLDRFVFGTTAPDGHGALEHPLVSGSPFSSNAGCGLTNHPDGTMYSNTDLGVVKLNANTGAQIGAPFGPPGNALGITVDPQTGNLVYVAEDCRSTPACTLITINPITMKFSNFAVLPSSEATFVDGIYFDPSGNFLFLSNRSATLELTVLNRSGSVVQNIPMNATPDGVAFHVNPTFLVTNNNEGTMTRFDFPGNDFTKAPTVSLFASGGFRGDLAQVGADSCLYLSQEGTRFADNTTSGNNSMVRICPNFVPPPGVMPSLPSSTTCAGIYKGVFKGGAIVQPNQFCDITGGSIAGNVNVNGGTLTLLNTAVYGTIIAGPGSTVNVTGGAINSQGDSFSIFGSNTTEINLTNTSTNGTVETSGGNVNIMGTNIYGSLVTSNAQSVVLANGSIVEQNVELSGTTGIPGVFNTTSNALCDITIGGTLELLGNGAPFAIGDIAGCAEPAPKLPQGSVHVDGSVVLTNNTKAITFNDNYASQNLVCSGNSPAPTGATNRIGGAKTGQCAKF